MSQNPFFFDLLIKFDKAIILELTSQSFEMHLHMQVILSTNRTIWQSSFRSHLSGKSTTFRKNTSLYWAILRNDFKIWISKPKLSSYSIPIGLFSFNSSKTERYNIHSCINPGLYWLLNSSNGIRHDFGTHTEFETILGKQPTNLIRIEYLKVPDW